MNQGLGASEYAGFPSVPAIKSGVICNIPAGSVTENYIADRDIIAYSFQFSQKKHIKTKSPKPDFYPSASKSCSTQAAKASPSWIWSAFWLI